ncbi:Cthe_2314 family HEPN domain-containing protein [Paenibacillus sp. JX-17]|uniref:Cthe_2314 family HEPN domain-containing protein n=1 Tax=Paenibacillus lacisoli TaxID=3064525 RepID=A0ABT9CCS7_9BACL|nr:Cthe_2314 family HEPN domain-containing protein [Paenibacillus sp. JX-17]MDO7907070.1 Cthe_2314 family HEPN domain-containing protein [Paenibacillus sp. JX-17]
MLRTLLGELPRQNEGLMQEAIENMVTALQKLQTHIEQNNDPTHDYRRAEIFTQGLISSLDELEQSHFAAAFFRKKVKAGYVDDMTLEEQADYARYVYFYKDGFIRLFSVLDKLGNMLNDLYDLHTAKVKPHFSYFTVIRQFHYLKLHPELENKLYQINESYRDPVSRLRKRRNTEIHLMSAEMQDDLWQLHQSLHGKVELEDLDQHLEDLKLGLDMACKTLSAAFEYTIQLWGEKGLQPS